MALLPSVFRAQDHESMDDFSPVPIGDYLSQIVKSEVKPTKAAKEKMDSGDNSSIESKARILVIQEKILDGEYKGRLIFVNLNIVNPNSTAMEIANKELRSICDACGKAQVEDSAELHMIPHKITVGITPANASFPEKNKITKYEALEGTVVTGGMTDGNPFADDEETLADTEKVAGKQPTYFDDNIPF